MIRGASPGGRASVTVVAMPSTLCAITYTAPDGRIGRDSALNPKMTDAQGRATWTWIIPSTTAPGVGMVSVTCAGFTGSERILIGVGE